MKCHVEGWIVSFCFEETWIVNCYMAYFGSFYIVLFHLFHSTEHYIILFLLEQWKSQMIKLFIFFSQQKFFYSLKSTEIKTWTTSSTKLKKWIVVFLQKHIKRERIWLWWRVFNYTYARNRECVRPHTITEPQLHTFFPSNPSRAFSFVSKEVIITMEGSY